MIVIRLSVLLVSCLFTFHFLIHSFQSSPTQAGYQSSPRIKPAYEQAEGVPRVVRGPYLQTGTPSSLVVRWRTDIATDSRVRYGTDPNNLVSFVDDLTTATEHELKLTGLSAETRYYYSVGSPSDTLVIGADHFFVTAPAANTRKRSRIWVLGDSGTANKNQRAVRDAYFVFTDTSHTDLWVMLGDNAYRDGTDDEYQSAVFDIYPKMLRKSVLWPAFGNHDGHSASSPTESGAFYDIFTLPTNAEAGGVASETEAYYSFDYANIHFICLNSHDMPRSQDGEMLSWLRDDLAANTLDWTIAFWHHPPYSQGSHDSDRESKLIQMRTNALPILEDGGVDLVLTGHSHSYERSFLLDEHYGDSSALADSMIIDAGDGRLDGDNAYYKATLGPASHEGAVYIVAGSSGKISGGSLDHPAMYISLNVLGSVVLDVDSSRMDVTFLDNTGVKRDYFTFLKGSIDVPVPVELTSFSASVSESKVLLKWQTQTETNNYGFDVERSTTSYWQRIGFVRGKGTIVRPQAYEFRDDLSEITPGAFYVRYRLKQIDTDGAIEYSQVISIALALPTEAQLEQNYPNPFNPTTNISYTVPDSDVVTLKIYDMLGREVRTLVHGLQPAGTHSVHFSESRIASGTYFYTLQIGKDFVQTKRMTIVR